MALPKLCSTSADMTDTAEVENANASAATPTTAQPIAAAIRLSARRSTAAPPGNWLTTATRAPTLKARPISPSLHPDVAR